MAEASWPGDNSPAVPNAEQLLRSPRREEPVGKTPLRRRRLRAKVSPLDYSGRVLGTWTVEVVQISERTITFRHLVTLAARQVIVTFEKRGMSTHSLAVELTWCRFDEPHQYTSGGRFLTSLGRTA